MKEESLIGHTNELVRIIFKSRQPADTIAKEFFRSKKYIGASDRRFISEVTFRIQRQHATIEAYQHHHAIDTIAEAAVQLDRDEHAMEFLTSLPHTTQINTQPWLLEETLRGFDDAEHIWQSMMESAALCLRVNLLRVSREQVLEVLSRENIPAVAGEHSPAAIVVNKRVNLTQHDLYKEGFVEVQDEASQMIAYGCEVHNNMTVLDACAGAGGKTLHLACLMNNTGTIIAQDIEWKRLKEVQKRAHRAGVSNIDVELITKKTLQREQHYDVVLIDAPCTGMGTVRRLPMIKWRLQPEQLVRYTNKQLSILRHNANSVKIGGVLVYATCSILPSENHDVTQQFLSDHPHFELITEQQFDPYHHGTDGLYYSRMKRVS